MEPITLCGIIIVLFGLWVEFEPMLMAVVKTISKSKFYQELIVQPIAQKPAYIKRMPVCVDRVYNC